MTNIPIFSVKLFHGYSLEELGIMVNIEKKHYLQQSGQEGWFYTRMEGLQKIRCGVSLH
jgi:hypothetical protein